ncbi:MAG: ADP-ribosylglycohydrolase family protein [Haloferacaceae archaeon]
MDREDRAAGALLGLACGDALGRPVDGLSSAEIARTHGRVTEMRAGGSRGKPAGTTTGETALALCVARSLRATGGFDPADLSDRIRAWRASADAADPVAAAVGRLDDGPGSDAPADAAAAPDVGVLVRGAPPAVAYADPERLAAVVTEATRLTHPAPAPVGSAVALAGVVRGLLDGVDAATALDDALSRAVGRDAPSAVRTALAVATEGPASVDAGDAAGVLEAALHDALTADGPESAVVAAVNRGRRAAAAGAATGAVAGARFGAGALPDRWLDHLDGVAEYRDLVAALDRGTFE